MLLGGASPESSPKGATLNAADVSSGLPAPYRCAFQDMTPEK